MLQGVWPRRERETEHSTYVQMVVDGGFFACCRTCGSDAFPNRVILQAAEADARGHGRLLHIYDETTLREHNLRTAASLPLT